MPETGQFMSTQGAAQQLWRGEITLGYTGEGKRARRKVSGTTKAAVVDKLRDLHNQLDKGTTPKAGYTHYTLRQAADDWLAHGLEGRSPKTIKKNQNVLEPILTVIGARKLRDLTAADIRQALAAIAAGYSTVTVSMGHPALKRAIRHAEGPSGDQRAHGETKTERSRRTLALPAAAVQALRAWTDRQASERPAAGQEWQDTGLVFTTCHGAALDAGNVRKMSKRVCTQAGIGDSWTPRELRTSFVSLMSHRGVSIEEIARLVAHACTRTTEIVYRGELRPVITTSAES
jgi:integrase